MKTVNLRWSRSERSFPQWIGGGTLKEPLQWMIYADVSLLISQEQFDKFRFPIHFFHQLFRTIRTAAGDISSPWESRLPNGDYMPWGDNDFGPGGQGIVLAEYYNAESND